MLAANTPQLTQDGATMQWEQCLQIAPICLQCWCMRVLGVNTVQQQPEHELNVNKRKHCSKQDNGVPA